MTPRRCIYCGWSARHKIAGQPAYVCGVCLALVELDPHYLPELTGRTLATKARRQPRRVHA